MTNLGKSVIVGGILIFTGGTLLWIVRGDWHWFAGGGTLFLASVLTSAVLSAETKQTTTTTRGQYRPRQENIQRVQDDWTQPTSPPPDHEDNDAWTT